ncbi:hypothetical protein [Massilimicrobiota timonensis]|jgi:hypothetical protein|uniref:hypothetical protein n=1 Tax=Massilimicrobiota timonensis TaxID=1776392 RepID=UPI00101D34EF|nr:hypothetical protein [Massilimicrobiota timonensis]
MECTENIMTLDWNEAIRKAQEELKSLRQMELIFGTTITIMTRIVIIEEALKMHEKGDTSKELYVLLMGNE